MTPILGIWASQISGHLWAPAGAYDALATVTVPSGGAASIDFAGIPTGYKHLQIRGISRLSYGGTSGADYIVAQMNADTTYTNYRAHYLYGSGSGTPSAGTFQSATYPGAIAATGALAASLANSFSVSVCDVLDYSSTSKYKTLRLLTGDDFNGSGEAILMSSLWMNTSAITSLSLKAVGGNLAAGTTFALYGIK